MSEVGSEKADSRVRLPRLNLRPFLVAAMGLLCGIWLYGAALLGEGKAAGIAVFVLFILLLLPPFTIRRAAAVLGVFGFFLLIGLGGVHLAARNFTSGVQEGEYTVTGTVERAAVKDGYMRVTLSSLTFDGVREAGRMELTLPGEDVRAGDVITFTGTVTRNALPSDGDSYALYDFASDFRYGASTSAYEKTGVSANVFLRLGGALYDSLHMYMEEDAAELSYALLTGNTQGVDVDFVAETRAGGIAHIFAVSGLHIGMLYGAVTLLLRRWCGRWTFFPAILLSAGYCAMCAFTVSSVRALLMCSFAGGARFFGRKNDLLSSLSLAAVITLLFSPAQFFSVSFRLSYGAVAGICLFSEPLSRGLRRFRVPKTIAACLVSGISVQIFTFPLVLSSFGYFSLWGLALNLIVIPVLPALFLPLVACAFLSLVFPFAASVLLAFPQGLSSALLVLFSAADFSAVLAGFSLGAGVGVWLALSLPLGARVRLKAGARTVACTAVAALFVMCVCLENMTFAGCRIDVSGTDRGTCALIRTDQTAVLLIDGEVTLSACEDFLDRTYAGRLDAVCIVSEDEGRAINVAAFLPADVIYAAFPVGTGLNEREVIFEERFFVEGLSFVYEAADRLTLNVQGCVTEFAFGKDAALSADLFVGSGGGRLKYLLKDGIIRSL